MENEKSPPESKIVRKMIEIEEEQYRDWKETQKMLRDLSQAYFPATFTHSWKSTDYIEQLSELLHEAKDASIQNMQLIIDVCKSNNLLSEKLFKVLSRKGSE